MHYQDNRFLAGIVLFIAVLSAVQAGAASPTGWAPNVIPVGREFDRLQTIPIEQRPGRPMHVVGNTIRMLSRTPSPNRPWAPLRQIVLGTDRLADEIRLPIGIPF
ncbi:MAG: hypothetical protein AAGC97_04700 [Planctomycetota bacterium]